MMGGLQQSFLLLLAASLTISYKPVSIPFHQGNVTGTDRQLRSNNVFAFLGIPYAKPPIGLLRFQPPVTYNSDGGYDATNFKPSCLQDKDKLLRNFPEKLSITSEDCLYLNIFVPNSGSKTVSGLNVMVWIHGGDFQYGSGNVFDGTDTAAKSGAIVVTFNYRLGVFGFLSANLELSNLGLLDQIAALKWVRMHIKYFGGDPEKVTVFGEGSGSISVVLHAMSPISQRLFTRAILHGGTDTNRFITKNPQVNRHILMALTECVAVDTNKEDMECLRDLDAQKLLKLTLNKHMFQPFWPSKTSDFFSSSRTLFSSRNQSGVEYLIGIVNTPYSISQNGEANGRINFLQEAQDLSGKSPRILTETIYSLLLSHYIQNNSDVNSAFAKLKQDRSLSESITFAEDISGTAKTYVYSIPEKSFMGESTSDTIKHGDNKVTDALLNIWIEFAETGNPGANFSWPDFYRTQKYTEIQNSVIINKHINNIMDEKDRLLWLQVIPNILALSQTTNNSSCMANDVGQELTDIKDHPIEYQREWGMSKKQVEALLVCVVLALLFVTVICIGLIRMLLQPPIFKSSDESPIRLDSFTKHVYDNDAISLTNSNGQSVTSIELKDSKQILSAM